MISREEARTVLKDMHDCMHDGYMTHLAHGGKQDGTIEDDIEALSVAIEALSQPERPKGRWINHTGILICSECGAGVNGSKSINHFCPHCGADMRGEEE